MDETYIGEFLTFLAVKRNVAASTQNQELSAILFLYRHVLKKEVGWVDNVERAKKPSRLPVVFTRDEAKAILVRLEGAKWLMVEGHGCQAYTFDKSRSETILLICSCGSLSTV